MPGSRPTGRKGALSGGRVAGTRRKDALIAAIECYAGASPRLRMTALRGLPSAGQAVTRSVGWVRSFVPCLGAWDERERSTPDLHRPAHVTWRVDCDAFGVGL